MVLRKNHVSLNLNQRSNMNHILTSLLRDDIDSPNCSFDVIECFNNQFPNYDYNPNLPFIHVNVCSCRKNIFTFYTFLTAMTVAFSVIILT